MHDLFYYAMSQEGHYCKKESNTKPYRSLSFADNRLDKLFIQIPSRRSESAVCVNDRSNSASPTRKQPHPYAMHAMSSINGQRPRLPQWPPPDPPPLTPVIMGFSRYFFGATLGVNNTSPVWTLRPWGRGNRLSRPVNQIIRVNIGIPELTDDALFNPTAEESARMVWVDASDAVEEITTGEIEVMPTPQLASLTEVEDSQFDGSVSCTSALQTPSTLPSHSGSYQTTVQSLSEGSSHSCISTSHQSLTYQATVNDSVNEEVMYGLEEEDSTEFVLVMDSNLDSHITLHMSDEMLLVGQLILNNSDSETEMT
ncbi:unnamed protein product [Trichobilharzia regenti]|uniref:Fibronectin type-III domain-containing protein n=1 Tax=Trichobilharzia regenti TaxID=157069 RepID=A0A183X011_TRIRE|nr:unnamed protein product [Trichobilharzia regenti]VDQ13596.1 unnamed protein product [Trichobilharzia regenti]